MPTRSRSQEGRRRCQHSLLSSAVAPWLWHRKHPAPCSLPDAWHSCRCGPQGPRLLHVAASKPPSKILSPGAEAAFWKAVFTCYNFSRRHPPLWCLLYRAPDGDSLPGKKQPSAGMPRVLQTAPRRRDLGFPVAQMTPSALGCHRSRATACNPFQLKALPEMPKGQCLFSGPGRRK